MDAQGQQTYQVVGDPDTRPRGEAGSTEGADAGSDAEAADDAIESGFSEDDVEIVATRTGVSEAEAREALEETGDLAAAVQKLE
jgi:nascent polypeptide-associated complex subunit alpha